MKSPIQDFMLRLLLLLSCLGLTAVPQLNANTYSDYSNRGLHRAAPEEETAVERETAIAKDRRERQALGWLLSGGVFVLLILFWVILKLIELKPDPGIKPPQATVIGAPAPAPKQVRREAPPAYTPRQSDSDEPQEGPNLVWATDEEASSLEKQPPIWPSLPTRPSKPAEVEREVAPPEFAEEDDLRRRLRY